MFIKILLTAIHKYIYIKNKYSDDYALNLIFCRTNILSKPILIYAFCVLKQEFIFSLDLVHLMRPNWNKRVKILFLAFCVYLSPSYCDAMYPGGKRDCTVNYTGYTVLLSSVIFS